VKGETPHVDGRRVGLFLLLTFAISWSFEPLTDRFIGRRAYADLGIAPWSMLVPAAVALSLRLFLLRDSPIHVRRFRERSIWIPVSFIGLTVLYGLVTVLALAMPEHGAVLGGLGSLLTTLWTLSLFWLYRQVGEEGFRRVRLPLGDRDRGFRFAIGTVLFLLSQAALNLLFGLGRFQAIRERIYDIPLPAPLYPVALILAFGLAVTGTPLAGLAATFGEEYAWRGFLQAELFRLGRRRGALLIGLIWGFWHFPVILSGVHTYPPTALGLLLALVFFALWGFVQSYAVLKTGSVWVAAFLHGLVNSVYAFTLTYLVRPADSVFSFGLGIYGLLCLGLVAALVLRDPAWRASQQRGAAPSLSLDQEHEAADEP
jgi:membrane protease YdiL (CAAX protease family)